MDQAVLFVHTTSSRVRLSPGHMPASSGQEERSLIPLQIPEWEAGPYTMGWFVKKEFYILDRQGKKKTIIHSRFQKWEKSLQESHRT